MNKVLVRARASVWVVLFLVPYVALAVHSEYWLGVTIKHPIGQDFNIYYRAYQKALQGLNPYEPFGIGAGYINHPGMLSFVSLFAWSAHPLRLWIAGSAVTWLASVCLAQSLARQAWFDQSGTEAIASSRAWFVALIFLGFAPLWETIHVGQVNAFAVCCILSSLQFARKERSMLAGLALALAIMLKTSPIVFLAYFGVMRRVRIVTWTVIGLAVMSVLAAAQFSPLTLRQFWDLLPRLGSNVYPDTNNQSILSVLYQGFSVVHEHSVKTVLVHLQQLAFVAFAGTLLLKGLGDSRSNNQLSIWLFMALTTVSVFFSPLVWYHHSAFLLLPLTVLLISPHRTAQILGFGTVLLIQAERLFERSVTLTAYPITAVQITLVMTFVLLFLSRKTPARAAPESGERGGGRSLGGDRAVR